ncbi:thymidine kinase [Paenarthrobacter ureafaciens]|uniref:thymidine kinase n=1 Tax=Paenarthrobacter TaxID=1742992 RepID=UPI00140A3995|nr:MULTISPECIES: thymidine kinase [Paenarthrobacter]MCW3765427.1 thymidine kinase [Paenarthrobacter sp. PAE-2]MCX8455299.1 thymidine kinase [Paenarthrobacter ureafaciens]MCY0974026.1 thymidine kinase [Paenarthrobacter ureafaciens]QQQ63862.1 thymidine kinase [Paenarthrobacter ureafaciens]
MAELVFFSGTMDCGKSTLALQMDYNHRARGRGGVRFSCNDRAGDSTISSRLGLQTDAVEVHGSTDFWDEVVVRRTSGLRVDYLICDEAQFYAPAQVEQLARLVDEMDVDVFAFGITADFRTKLFPGSQRLIELADRVQVLQVEALCWCGRRATQNARTVNGIMVVEGEQVMVGDVASSGSDAEPAGLVGYETLCRRHYMRRVTAHGANLMAGSDQTLPFDVDACLWPGAGDIRA